MSDKPLYIPLLDLTRRATAVSLESADKRSGPVGWAFFRVRSNSVLQTLIVEGWALQCSEGESG